MNATRSATLDTRSQRGGDDEFLVFPRDENGKLDLENGTYSSEKKCRMKKKCDQEARFCFGAAIVKKLDNNPTKLKLGVRCEPFNHSGKLLLSIKDHKARQRAEMARVKSLSDKKGKWVTDSRPENAMCQNDELTVLKQCGKKTAEKFENHNVGVVDLKEEISSMQWFMKLAQATLKIESLQKPLQTPLIIFKVLSMFSEFSSLILCMTTCPGYL